jgi:hypothetical protein
MSKNVADQYNISKIKIKTPCGVNTWAFIYLIKIRKFLPYCYINYDGDAELID